MDTKKYTVVGGNPIREYTGTTTFTSLSVIGINLTKEEADKVVKDNYDNCGGLLIAFNSEDGNLLEQ